MAALGEEVEPQARLYLEGARPIDVLHLRGVADVLAALDSLEQTAWGG
jgi:hypothetical protein